MIYMRNITITTAKSATYLENVGSIVHLKDGVYTLESVNDLSFIEAGKE